MKWTCAECGAWRFRLQPCNTPHTVEIAAAIEAVMEMEAA